MLSGEGKAPRGEEEESVGPERESVCGAVVGSPSGSK